MHLPKCEWTDLATHKRCSRIAAWEVFSGDQMIAGTHLCVVHLPHFAKATSEYTVYPLETDDE